MAAPIGYHGQQVPLNQQDLSCRSEWWSTAKWGGIIAGTMTGACAIAGFCVEIISVDASKDLIWLPTVLAVVSVASFTLAVIGNKRHDYYETLRSIRPEVLQLQQQF